MSKYIAAAVAKQGGPARIGPPPGERFFKDRPALEEYMTSTEGPGGVAREPSVVMIVATEDGVKVGLKDDDAGGWCWREADTVEQGLNALEKALASGKPVFRAPGGRKAKR